MKFNFDAHPEIARRRAEYDAAMRLPAGNPERTRHEERNPMRNALGRKFTLDVTVTDPFLFNLCIGAMFNEAYPGVPGAELHVCALDRDRTTVRDYLRAELARVEAEINGQPPTG